MNQLVFMDRTLFITIKSEKPRPSNKKCTLKNRESKGGQEKGHDVCLHLTLFFNKSPGNKVLVEAQ